MKQARRHEGRGAFDLIEEATHLLRTAPVSILTCYYIGSIPFVLGLLYNWADMSRSPFAPQHLADFGLGMAGLFSWMKCWQTVFARQLRAHFAHSPASPWTLRRCIRVFLTQTFLQPSGLFVVPLALIPILPALWVYAFYQNLTALDDGISPESGVLLKKSWKQATLWPRQNLIGLLILFGFAVCVFLNWMVAGLILPHLIKMLFGIDSVFSQSTLSLLNTTFFAGMAALTYLCVDPIIKTLYVLRCFYGESLESGEDLKGDLKSAIVSLRPVSVSILILLTVLVATPAGAAATTPAASSGAPVSTPLRPADLDQSINRTIHETKYTWRMPRTKVAEADQQEGLIARFFDKIGSMFRRWAHSVLDWLDRLFRKLFRHRQTYSSSESTGYGWIEALQILLYGLVAVAVSALAILLIRVWQRRGTRTVTAAEPAQPLPDISDENIGADQMPEDGWTKLARELLDRGELRLALRAFYFASLSHLATRNLISFALFKSNLDYERELRRRAHSFPELVSVFGDNRGSFERVWYGLHEVDRDLVDRFANNVERIKATA